MVRRTSVVFGTENAVVEVLPLVVVLARMATSSIFPAIASLFGDCFIRITVSSITTQSPALPVVASSWVLYIAQVVFILKIGLGCTTTVFVASDKSISAYSTASRLTGDCR